MQHQDRHGRNRNRDDERDFDRNDRRARSREQYEGQDYAAGGTDRYGNPARSRDYEQGRGGAGDYDRGPAGPRSRQQGDPGGRNYSGGQNYGGSGYGDRSDRGYYGGRQGWADDYDRDERDWMSRAGDEVRSWFGDDEAAHRRKLDGHRGKGPKNYRRTDERIEEDVNDRLTDDMMVDATGISVSVSDGEVTLDGTVDSKLAKRGAEDCCDSVAGVQHVQNNLRVSSGSSNSWNQESSVSASSSAKRADQNSTV